MRQKRRYVAAAAWAAAPAAPPYAPALAGAGAGILPWLAAAAVAALGIGAVTYALIRRRAD